MRKIMESGVSNIGRYTDKMKPNKLHIFFYVLLFFMFVLVPTSSNGLLPSLDTVIVNWAILGIVILWCTISFAILDWKQLFIVLITLAFLMVITVFSNYFDARGKFSIARVAPIVCFLSLSTLSIKNIVSLKTVKVMTHMFMALFFVWNILIVFDSEVIKDFTVANYTQLYQDATSNMFIKSRPVMSFGIYTFASYFYFMFFLVTRSLYGATRHRIFFLYQILLLIANVLLVSNTAFVFSAIMFYYIFRSIKNIHAKLIVTLVTLVIVYYLFTLFNLAEYYLESFESENNGFVGRYAESGTLQLNLDYIKDNYFIGFNIIDNLTYSDSGYIVYFTMGGIVFMLVMYYSLYKFARNNFSNLFLLFLIPTMIFEFALPVIIYYKFIYAALFLAISFRSIENFSDPNI